MYLKAGESPLLLLKRKKRGQKEKNEIYVCS
jgi:hypothetical protein